MKKKECVVCSGVGVVLGEFGEVVDCPTCDGTGEVEIEVDEPKKEKLDSHFAVFNCHINNAKERTYKEMQEFHPGWYQEVVDLEEKEEGIMGIFNHAPTPATAAFVALVTHFVNEERG